MPDPIEIIKERAATVWMVALKDWVPLTCRQLARRLSLLYWRSLKEPSDEDLKAIRRVRQTLSRRELQELLARDVLSAEQVEAFQHKRAEGSAASPDNQGGT